MCGNLFCACGSAFGDAMVTESPERLFDQLSGVAASWTTIAAAAGDVPEEESEFLANAVPKRVREFSAGRRLARYVLREFGTEVAAIPAGRDRLPVWPGGYSGSISHTAERVAVAICRSDRYRGIGLDIETARSLDRELIRSVLTVEERRHYPPEAIDPTILFSCKESVYKAVYPLFREFIEFQDVEIDYRGGTFRANCRPGKESADWIALGRGFACLAHDHIVSVFLI